MNLANGMCYKRPDGIALRVQLEEDGDFHFYDANGKSYGTIKENDHVNGWVPMGASQFSATATPKEKKRSIKSDKGDGK